MLDRHYTVLFNALQDIYCPESLLSRTSCESEHCSVVSNSLRLHGLYSPWNSPGQNTGVGWDLPNPGTESRSPALQADSLPAEQQGKQNVLYSLKYYTPKHLHTFLKYLLGQCLTNYL